MQRRYYILDVFTDQPFGGNPLAVVLDAEGLDGPAMQRIAREFHLSETAFVLPPAEGRRRVRIFTPQIELPFAGHPTVGTAVLLAELGLVPTEGGRGTLVLAEAVGDVRVEVVADGDAWRATLTAAVLPERGPPPPPAAALAAVLGLAESDVGTADGWAPAAYSCGVPFLFVPVRSRDALGRIAVDRTRWASTLAQFWAPHVYAFCPAPGQPGPDVRARMFAPAMGIDEDPATGGAATALAGYLVHAGGFAAARATGRTRWVVEQGCEMGRPSVLTVEAELRDGALTAARVGGRAVRVAAGMLTVEPSAAGPPRERLPLEFFRRVWAPPHDLDAIDELMTEDYAITSGGVTVRGRAAFKRWVAEFQQHLGDATNETLEVFANAAGDRVVSRWVCRGRNRGVFGLPPDGRPVAFTGLSVWRVEGDRLAECWVERAAWEAHRALAE